MKKARVESKKVRKATKPHRVAGVPVRSGVKAGLGDIGGYGDMGGGGWGRC